jgi:Lysozyme inhibitor LprI
MCQDYSRCRIMLLSFQARVAIITRLLSILFVWLVSTEHTFAQCYFLECPPGQRSAPAPPVGQVGGPPSFDCATHHGADEIAVCGNGKLSQLDRRMANVFVALRNSLGLSGQTRLRDEQRVWLRQRALCRGDESCLTRAYEARITQLQKWQ